MMHDYNEMGISMTSETDVAVGFIQAHEFGGSGFVEKVVVEPSAFNDAFTFNVKVDGNDLFAATQAPAGPSAETFVPDQNRNFTGSNVKAEFSVEASATAGTIDVGILVDDRKD